MGNQGIYHSAYDSYHWLSKFGDPGFRYHATTAQMSAMMLLRMADADILPYDYVEYAKTMRMLADTAAKNIASRRWTISIAELTAAIARMDTAARAFNVVRDSALLHGLPAARRKRVNTLLMQVERAFVRPNGLKDRAWYRNVIYAADKDNGYSNISFPTINEAVMDGDKELTVREITDLAHRFDRAAQILVRAARSLR